MKKLIKFFLKLIPIHFTKNMEYDALTKLIIEKRCKADSNCIDIGCHKGEILDIFLKFAKNGEHYAFEPIPVMYKMLVEKYKNLNCLIYPTALSDKSGITTFNYVKSNPAYSGLLKREYRNANENIEEINVATDTLDNVIPCNILISIIKIDVEGAELQVLKGAVETIKRSKPLIIFEHGLGASEFYGSTPAKVFKLLSDCGLHIFTLKSWLSGESTLTLREFEYQFYNKLNYYFIASPQLPLAQD